MHASQDQLALAPCCRWISSINISSFYGWHLTQSMSSYKTVESQGDKLNCTFQVSICISCGFSSSHVWMWQLDHKESWALKNWCFRTVMLEKTLESPLECKGIKPVNLKGNQSWIFIGRTDAKAETLILWPPHVKSWLTGKDSDVGRDWGREKKGMTEDEMAGWHHQLHAHKYKWTPGVGDGQGGLACCDSWGRKESDTTEWLNWTEYTF